MLCGDAVDTGGGLIGMVVWGFDQASPTSLLGRRRPGGSSPATWSLLRTGFGSCHCLIGHITTLNLSTIGGGKLTWKDDTCGRGSGPRWPDAP
ncbi:hypothetical protein LWI29_030039 [Acer saccharum]|uniref:Uncharacterized protein n=1 Tax=Acer saccharum TaxID=4024 RepID=A0AA39RMF1_ACESA|nr:hypothetical protein LWI29_030039 [Acer saccharum]